MARCPHCDQNHADGADYCPRTGRPIVDIAKRMVGRTIAGKYRLLRSIGQGGMGTIFEAEHHVIGHKVALKLLHEPFAISREPVQRLYREARATGAIGHPNIIKVYDVSETEEGVPFLVMELLEGRSLGQIIEEDGPKSLGFVLDIGIQMMSALEAAHKAGVIHRDLKSDNVFISTLEDGKLRAKLLDFGISKLETKDQESLRLTQTGAVLGTPYYMAPEQAAGRKDLDHRIDIYASGVILFEMLLGNVPHRATNYNALLMEIISRDVQPFSWQRRDLPPELEAVVLKALRRDRRERWPDARALREKLVSIRERLDRDRLDGAAEVLPELPQERLDSPTMDAACELGDGVDTPMGIEDTGLIGMELTGQSAVSSMANGWSKALPLVGVFMVIAALVAGGMMLFLGPGYLGSSQDNAHTATAARPDSAGTWPSGSGDGAESKRRDPDYIRVKVIRAPAQARASINGRLIPEQGLDVKRGDSPLSLVVRADGYEVQEISFLPTEDREINVSLSLLTAPVRAIRSGDNVKPVPMPEARPAPLLPSAKPDQALDRPMDNPF